VIVTLRIVDGAGSAPPAITLRPVGESDHEFLGRVFAGTRFAEFALVDWDNATKEAFIQQQFAAQHRQYTTSYPEASFAVVLVDDEPAGRLYVAHLPEEVRVIDIALLPEFRGRGIGTALMANVLADADTQGVAVTLHVHRDNRAQAWYYRLGFALVEDRDPYLFLRRGVTPVTKSRPRV
jgi:ribosomal protein S18 acetylase RimI-like enzyme